MSEPALWVFGYGSLIWRPGFEYDEKRIATVAGYRRSFCQASHDHRGTPDLPGRVVTLESVANSVCEGIAFKVRHSSAIDILRLLDIREQDGYARQSLRLEFQDGSVAQGITWIAEEGNPSWRGGEHIDEVAGLISKRYGPSGSNSDYLFELERALVESNIVDYGVAELSEKVRSMLL